MDIRAHVLITGRVQGVFYRASTRDMAEQFGLTGWVKNTSDGRVEAVFEGEENSVKNMVKWCYQGPRFSDVLNVKVTYEKFLREFDEFSIKH